MISSQTNFSESLNCLVIFLPSRPVSVLKKLGKNTAFYFFKLKYITNCWCTVSHDLKQNYIMYSFAIHFGKWSFYKAIIDKVIISKGSCSFKSRIVGQRDFKILYFEKTICSQKNIFSVWDEKKNAIYKLKFDLLISPDLHYGYNDHIYLLLLNQN